MTTIQDRAFVSTVLLLSLAACAPRHGTNGPAPGDVRPLSLRFTNDGRERVHVYVVGERREWLLGRVDPGATAWLPVPVRALTAADGPGMVRLAVLPGAPPTVQALRDPRAQLTLAQPAMGLLSQRWSWSQGQVVAMPATSLAR